MARAGSPPSSHRHAPGDPARASRAHQPGPRACATRLGRPARRRGAQGEAVCCVGALAAFVLVTCNADRASRGAPLPMRFQAS